jgi:hypothetical protein
VGGAGVSTINRVQRRIARMNASLKSGQLLVKLPESMERDIQKHEVEKVLPLCSKIAKVWRQNNGAAMMDSGKWVRFGETGIPDFIGFLKDGRFFAIEVKRPGKEPTTEQADFLQLLNNSGGVGIVAYRGEDVLAAFR